MMVWYDQRDDLAQLALGNGAFSKYIEDSLARHTIDIRVAQAVPGINPKFGRSERVSRYLHIIDADGLIKQVEFNPPNYPLFQMGTMPFHGDYIDIASQTFVYDQSEGWTYNTERSNSTVFHTTWVDNRDVRPPGGDWWIFPWPPDSYNAPADGCNPSFTGTRNQNVYTSTITSGVIAGSYGNTKQFTPPDYEDRTFIIFLENTTSEVKSFMLTINSSDNSSEATASFRQDPDNNTLTSLDVEIPPYSTVTRTVFVRFTGNIFPLIRIDVVEIDTPGGSELPGGHTDYILLNPDPTNPFIKDYWNPENDLVNEYHTPRVENPRVWNYVLDDSDPNELNPRVLNPRVENPRVLNPRVLNPRVLNPRVENPRVENINFVNNEMANPRVENPRVENTAMADVTWEVANDGNTTSAYTLNILSNAAVYDEEGKGYIPDPAIIAQILVFKMHTAPVDRGCELKEERQDELVLNITNPRVENPSVWNPRVENLSEGNPRVENPRVENATFALAPGEQAYVVFRVWDDNVSGNTAGAFSAAAGPLSANTVNPGWLSIENIIGTESDPTVGAAISTHAPDTGEDEPTVVISANAAPVIGHSSSPSPLEFVATEGDTTIIQGNLWIETEKGILDYTLHIEYENPGESWLELDLYEGMHTAGNEKKEHLLTVNPSGLLVGTHKANIVIEAPGALNSPESVPVTLTITSAAAAPTVSTTVVSGITPTSATSGGDVTSDGGASVTARGVCWNTSGNPTLADSHTIDGSGTGVFTSSISGLIPGTTYYVKAYATNSIGTSYGSDVIFTTMAIIECDSEDYSISPTENYFSSSGGNSSVVVTTTNINCPWSATVSQADESWIQITSEDSGVGSGIVNYSVDSNSSTNIRTGTMTIAGKTFTVHQSGTILVPADLSLTLSPGESFEEKKTATLPSDEVLSKVDIMFMFDLSGSMGDELITMNSESQNIMADLRTLVPDSRFGVISFIDYNATFNNISCANNYSGTYGSGSDYPYRLDQAITTETEAVSAAINDLILGYGNDLPESYSRALYELYSDENAGWRTDAKKIAILFGDDIPHDPTYGYYGIDPGRDNEVCTPDDLYFAAVIAGLVNNNITVLVLYSGIDGRKQPWIDVTSATGGALFGLSHQEASQIPTVIENLVKAEVQTIDLLTLRTEEVYENWVSFDPSEGHSNVPFGNIRTFTLTITVPADADPGTYRFMIELIGDDTVLAWQIVHITVGTEPAELNEGMNN